MSPFIRLKRTWLFPFLLLLLIQPISAAYGQERDFELNVKVPPKTWKTARLKRLVKDAIVSIQIKGTDTVDIFILNKTGYLNYPDVVKPLFKGRSYDNLSFSVTIPESGNYFLVLDNKEQKQSAELQLRIHAITAKSKTSSGELSSQLQSDLSQISTKLNKLFIFDPFPINLQSCGKEGAFGNDKGVVLCFEFVQKIQESMPDTKKATDVLLFAIFHEICHVLLHQWDYPFFDNEELTDEFATALLIMLKQKDRLSASTEYFISNPSAQELMTKTLQSDRHPLSIQRARNIVDWMNDPTRIIKWQRFLIPHMQTSTLQTLQKDVRSTFFRKAIDRELTLRP